MSGSVVVIVMRMVMMNVAVVFFVRFGAQVSMIAFRTGKNESRQILQISVDLEAPVIGRS